VFDVQTVEIAKATRVGVARAGRVDSRSKIDMKRKEESLGGEGSLYTFSRVALVRVGEAGAFPDSENFGVDLVMEQTVQTLQTWCKLWRWANGANWRYNVHKRNKRSV
jgi:hypothetical protein